MLLAASVFTSCGAGDTDRKPEENPDTPETTAEPTKDVEDETALEPVEVSGAYLTSVGSPVGNAVPAKPGFRPVGANIFVAKTGNKVTDPVVFSELKFTDAAGKTASVQPVLAADTAGYQAIFFVPEVTADPIPGLELVVSVNESKEFSVTGSLVSQNGDAASDTIPSVNANAPEPLANVSVHQIYVTNGRFLPGTDFKNARDANQLCNKEAAADPELSVVWWKAVLADETQTIAERIPLYGPVEDLLGNPLISSDGPIAGADLPAGALQFANFGTVGAGPNNSVFTGSKKDGSIGATCGGWTSSSGQATVGSPASGTSWVEDSLVDCSKPQRLYCISSKKKKGSP